jgi:uncharacterized SAM-dependent methyltransferase
MHLASLGNQSVNLGQHRFSFVEGETIHTENSYKYSPAEFGTLAALGGFKAGKMWTDPAGRFALFGLEAD